MATHDYVIDNQTAPNFRADLNNALLAIVSQNSNATAPTTTYANMIWYDSTNNQLKKRDEANSNWITLGTVDEGAGTFTPSGQPATQVQATWNTGTSTVESTITAAKLDDKIENKLNVSGSAPIYACRAWVNFNGTGTVSIRASGNVSSITDNASGDYTVNFTTAMQDANYAVQVSPSTPSSTGKFLYTPEIISRTVSTLRFKLFSDGGGTTGADSPDVSVAIFR